ncbi:hypothetical protein WICPIJ_001394 [Wickerhamomyces pijperi]|uniref:Uncharacterized protein n=1 Tax=Wickerhamomyces pijperi TaxID=599730 RepID=A0A9P8QDL8_WICPI|nr:hypothetical protein WICPIJ_001394 [Wickerhamomyces pijperi]
MTDQPDATDTVRLEVCEVLRQILFVSLELLCPTGIVVGHWLASGVCDPRGASWILNEFERSGFIVLRQGIVWDWGRLKTYQRDL